MTAARRRQNRSQLPALWHDGVLSRAELRDLGWDRSAVAREVAAGRWRRHGRHTVALRTALSWQALFEVGIGVALLDGITALQVAGLTPYDEPVIHVSIPRTARAPRTPGVLIHRVRHRHPGEQIGAGVPRTRPAVAAIRAAHWAVSDRQAADLLLRGGQQRLYRASDLANARTVIQGRTRRAFIDAIIDAVTDGVGHTWGLSPTHDHLKANAVTIERGVVLRMDLVCQAHARLSARVADDVHAIPSV